MVMWHIALSTKLGGGGAQQKPGTCRIEGNLSDKYYGKNLSHDFTSPLHWLSYQPTLKEILICLDIIEGL